MDERQRGNSEIARSRLRWAVVDWAKRYEAPIPLHWYGESPSWELAHRLMLLLALTCELPSGEIADYSYEDWARVLGVTTDRVLEAADILASWDISWRTGELTREGAGTHCVLDIPAEVRAQASALDSL